MAVNFGNDILKSLQNISVGNIPAFDFHMHTTWTDGQHSVLEMYRKAEKENLKFILFSEHARQSSEDWFFRFSREVRSLPPGPCKALVGVETKVIDDLGNLDISDKILDECDLVMASVHRFPGEKGIVRGFGEIDPGEALQIELKLALGILDNPRVDILGHPFGMSLRRFNIFPQDDHFIQLIQKAARKGVAIEINSHYHPTPWRLIEWCIEYGTLFSLGSNAHDLESVGRILRILNDKEDRWIP
jgi:putative hydrolase